MYTLPQQADPKPGRDALKANLATVYLAYGRVMYGYYLFIYFLLAREIKSHL